MRSLFIILAILVVFSGCVRKNKVPKAQDLTNTSMHEVKVAEVIQTSNYTYLKVSENSDENWIAVTKQEAAPGETYYYDKAMEMKNFNSKELDRTFESIYFVQEISKQPIIGNVQTPAGHKGKAEGVKKDGISVSPADGSVSIAQLYTDRNNYAGKTIKMKGQVVKVNEQVMGKNWIHIQDGTGDSETSDLTITTLDEVKVDDVVTFEGTISLKKDFGYGYFYEIIMEDAKLVN
ncbi:MAG TPA: GW dipeptide domain-containing protein [Prolixibacteraceae bacterium]|nr:GW dipeptide domain-containing protein [Prolixibacteraceae bacterium]